MSALKEMIFELGITITDRNTKQVCHNEVKEVVLVGRDFDQYAGFVEALEPVLPEYYGWDTRFAFERAKRVFAVMAGEFYNAANVRDMIGRGGTHDFYTNTLGVELVVTHYLKLKAVERQSVSLKAGNEIDPVLYGNILFANAIADITTERLKDFDLDKLKSFHLMVDVKRAGTQLKITARQPVFGTVFRFAIGNHYAEQGNKVVLQLTGERDWAALYIDHNVLFERNRLGLAGFEVVATWYVPESLLKLKADHAAKKEIKRTLVPPVVKTQEDYAYKVSTGERVGHKTMLHAFTKAQQNISART